MKNKLAYLGFLGLLGFGGFFGSRLMFAFFANFVFFSYIKVVPDELFWANVRVCATRGFFIFLIPSQIIMVATLILAANETLYPYASPLAIGGFALVLGIGIIVFSGNLEYLEAKEKLSKDDEKDY